MSEFNLAKEINARIDTEKFNVVRRKLSFDCNQDLTSDEVINILIDNAYKVSQPKKRNRVDMNLILKEVDNGASVRQVAEKFDISWSTVFRAKKLAKENQ
jgi:hypothetical protein